MALTNIKYCEPFFFLFGSTRSGTTLMENVINNSKQAYLTYECDWIYNLLDCYRHDKESVRLYDYFGPDTFRKGVNKMLCEIFAKEDKWGIQFIGAKNALYYYELAKIFPNAKWIQMVRDPRDTFISTLRTGISSAPEEFEFTFKSIETVSKLNKISVLVVKYEDLVSEPDSEIQRICSFLEIEYCSEMLLPLSQKISLNENPALTLNDLQEKKINPNHNCAERWKNQLMDEDLLDLNKYVNFIDFLGYKIYDDKKLKLEIKCSQKINGKLIGMRNNLDNTLLIEDNCLKVDICSTGCVGVELDGNIGNIEQIHLEKYGFFRKSSIYGNIFLLKLEQSGYSSLKNLKIHTFATLAATVEVLLPHDSIGLYTAGGATKTFLEQFKKKKLYRKYNIKYIIDKYKSGYLDGIPIIKPDSLEAHSLQCLIITSRVFFDEIRNDVISNKLKGKNNMHVVCFADQENMWVKAQEFVDFDNLPWKVVGKLKKKKLGFGKITYTYLTR